jgi:lipopolysaccharide heptosyltransferase II
MAKPASALSSFLKRAGQFIVYVLFCVVEFVLRLLPIGLVWRIGRVAGITFQCVFEGYRQLAIRNLRIAFGREVTQERLEQLARAHFGSLGANFLCSIKLPLMSEQEVLKRVVVEGSEHPQSIAAQGKPILYAITHMSCWELLTQVPSLIGMGKQITTIYQPLSNPFLDAHLRKNRQKHGYIAFDRNAGFSEPMRHMREHGSVLGVLVDQHAGDKGVWCPFFDRLASTTPLPALMSLRCDTPLIPMIVYDEGPGRWKITFYPPVVSREKTPSAEGLTAELNLAIERVIRVAPHNNFWVHSRWKTPKPGFLLSNYRRGITLPVGYDVARLQKFELLLRSPNWLGDACMAFPAVRALREGRPDLRLTVFTPGKLAQLWQSLGIIDDIITKDGKESVFAVSKRIKERTRFDAAILFTNSTRSTLEFWLAGIPRLVGFKGSLRSKLLHQITPEQKLGTPPEHQANKYLRLASHCGAKTDDPKLFAPGAPVASHDGMVRVGICAGAEYGQAKRWPLERFAEVANAIPQVEWVLFGAPGEAAMGEQLSSMLRVKHLNLVGKTSLDDLIHCLSECTLLVSNDTGTMHLAAALGVPTVSIFGSTEPILTGPLGPQHSIVRHHVPCSPCFKRECPFGHYECMTKIEPGEVAEVVRTRLAAERR